MINSLNKTDDFIKMIILLSKTGLGRSGHVRFQTFGTILHVSGSTNGILTKWPNDFASFFVGEAQTSSCFDQKPKYLIKITKKIKKKYKNRFS